VRPYHDDDELSGSPRFRLLGPIEATHGDRELTLGSPQQRAVLAVLLLRQGAVVPLDELIGTVWDDAPPRSAVTTLRTYVSRLRHVLEPTGVRVRSAGGGYALAVPPASVDAERFRRLTARAGVELRTGEVVVAAEALRAALALPAGPPLAGMPGRFAQGQRARLEQLLTDARLDLIEAELQLGRHREVLPDAADLAAAHPLWERPQELLMTTLHRCGRQAEALAHFQQTWRTRTEDLGIEPGARLRDLHQRILAGEPDLLAAAHHPAPIVRVAVHRPARRWNHRAPAGRRTPHRVTR
jgi:DNA-binding SARP family transcriptional activator